MKIVDKSKYETFGDLNIGDVFKINTRYYMRIGNVTTDLCIFNAVSLASAYAHNFNDTMKVQKVNATMFIGGEENESY